MNLRAYNMKESQELGRTQLRLLTARLGGQSQVAHLLNVNRSSVSRWFGKKPKQAQLTKIMELNLVLQKLLEVYKPSTALSWLNGINAHLRNQRPIDLIRHGRIAEVLSAIEQDATLAFA